MTSRLHALWVALVAATAIVAVFATPAVFAGVTFNFVD
jgi:hypothetical protein